MEDVQIPPAPDFFRELNHAKRDLRERNLNASHDRKLQGPVELMTRRDHFAAAALQGILSCTGNQLTLDSDRVVRGCVEYADKLIAKLDEVKHV